MAADQNQHDASVKAGDIHSFGAVPHPRLTPELLKLVKTGEVYSLEQIVEPGIPYWFGHPPIIVAPLMRHGDMPELAPASAANEITNLPMHGGTHIDALAHIGKWSDGEVMLYGGIKARDVMGMKGFAALGIENFPPIIVRGILLDVAGNHGVDVLPDSYGITGDDLKRCEEAQGVGITTGTAVLVRTGFSKYWKTENDRFSNRGAGINIDGARYLAGRGISLVGSDTEAVEQWPAAADGPPLPVHMHMITDHGITHVESLYLERLAVEKVYEFLFIALPLRIRGATGSQIHPIAIA